MARCFTMNFTPTPRNLPLYTRRGRLAMTVLMLGALCIAACSPGGRIARQQPIERSATVNTPAFAKATTTAVRSPWVDGNHITPLMNGAEFYPAMLKAIRGAEKSITFETYAFVNGMIAYEFVSAFCERAKAGVKVHLVLDAFGSEHLGAGNITRLRTAGVELRFYHDQFLRHPLRYYTRDHRKLMVVDGKTGFTGGCGIAQEWTGDTQTPKNWRENHYLVTGPVVAQLQRHFTANWRHTGGQPLTGTDYFPRLQKTGTQRAQNFISSPKDKLYTVPYLYRQAIASARKSIVIENSYLLPDRVIMKEILAARARGVHVEIIVPGKYTDAGPLRYFSRLKYHKLLSAGVHLYEYQKAMMHCKVMVVDGVFSSIGSANFDARSLYINDESNLNVLDAGFAREQLRMIDFDKQHSIRVTRARSPWHPLSYPGRLMAPIVTPQL